jgi:hypothetical protein
MCPQILFQKDNSLLLKVNGCSRRPDSRHQANAFATARISVRIVVASSARDQKI